MCQFTQLEKVEPQEIFAEKECRILQALLANITATDENKNDICFFMEGFLLGSSCAMFRIYICLSNLLTLRFFAC